MDILLAVYREDGATPYAKSSVARALRNLATFKPAVNQMNNLGILRPREQIPDVDNPMASPSSNPDPSPNPDPIPNPTLTRNLTEVDTLMASHAPKPHPSPSPSPRLLCGQELSLLSARKEKPE